VNFPRLVITDEIRPGTISPAVVLTYALQRMGIQVKVFTCARGEAERRLLRLLFGEPPVVLDPYLCGSLKNLKTLFQKTASPDALNVILVPMGEREGEDVIVVRSEPMDMAKAFSCGIVAIFSSMASAIQTSNIVTGVLPSFQEGGENHVLGVIFASLKNPREYQLLEQDYGRKTPIMSLGYIPKEIERPMPVLADLYSASAATRVMQVKSAVLQLISNPYQIEWSIISSLGHLKEEWTLPQEAAYLPKRVNIAIVGDSLFSMEGANARELFMYLGCEPTDYNPFQDPFPVEAEFLYFPNSTLVLYVDRLLEHDPFCQGIRQALAGNKLIFANGTSSLLFGRHIILPGGEKREALGFFPFHGTFSPVKADREFHRVEIRGVFDSIFNKCDEKMRGTTLKYAHVSNPGNVAPPMWAYRDVRKDAELGSSGWQKIYCVVTDLQVEPWSNIDIFNRWISLRKR
jgi:cobyrinic acid a,c-diamide synthase